MARRWPTLAQRTRYRWPFKAANPAPVSCHLPCLCAVSPPWFAALPLWPQPASGSRLLELVLSILVFAGLCLPGILWYRRRAQSAARQSAGLDQRLRAQTAELGRVKEQLGREIAKHEKVESELRRERSFMDIFMSSVPDAVYF